MTDNDIIRAAVMAMVKAGECTLSEAAELAGTSRQLIRYWMIRDGIDHGAARAAWLRSTWRRHIARARRS